MGLLFFAALGLSWLSNFSVKMPFGTNIEVALMLTPYGLFDNLVVKKESELKPYYWQKPNRKGLEESLIGFFVVFTSGTASALLIGLKRSMTVGTSSNSGSSKRAIG